MVIHGKAYDGWEGPEPCEDRIASLTRERDGLSQRVHDQAHERLALETRVNELLDSDRTLRRENASLEADLRTTEAALKQADAGRVIAEARLNEAREALTEADSALSWCVARHRADEQTKEAARAVARLARPPRAASITDPEGGDKE